MPGRVEAVGRLVEDQHLRVAEQRGGDRQALAHAHRVALHAAGRRRRSRPTAARTSSTRLRRMPAGERRGPAGGCGRCGPGGTRRPRAPRRRGRRAARARRSGAPPNVAEPDDGRTSPSSARSVVLLPAPLGPRKPVTRPASMSKERCLTAATPPKRLERSRISTGGHGVSLRSGRWCGVSSGRVSGRGRAAVIARRARPALLRRADLPAPRSLSNDRDARYRPGVTSPLS